MPRPRLLLMAASVAALALGGVAAPTVAAPPPARVTFVDGRPGPRVDVCIDGVETKHRMRYGTKMVRYLTAGQHTFKVFKADPRRCRGRLVLKHKVTFGSPSDTTLVATKKAPKLVVFDNPTVPPGGFGWAVRHAADFGNALVTIYTPPILAPSVVVDPRIFAKGDQWYGTSASTTTFPTFFDVEFLRPVLGGHTIVTGRLWFASGYWTELIAVGTTARNARMVHIKRLLPAP